jgi:hypothetical protein
MDSPSGKGSSLRGNESSMSKSITKIGARKKFRHKSDASMKFKKRGLPTEYSTMLDGFVDQVTAKNLINAKISKRRTSKNIKHQDGIGANIVPTMNEENYLRSSTRNSIMKNSGKDLSNSFIF